MVLTWASCVFPSPLHRLRSPVRVRIGWTRWNVSFGPPRKPGPRGHVIYTSLTVYSRVGLEPSGPNLFLSRRLEQGVSSFCTKEKVSVLFGSNYLFFVPVWFKNNTHTQKRKIHVFLVSYVPRPVDSGSSSRTPDGGCG